ncbi:hypothetical protein [Streptosporangium saharense]|uniref:Uncharacterized protein n=1 Tax=Streptosporangium saharense TaxID=1706840 RepID=A0A7W7VP89_9ACTN|nr:hypothetical protein [Streptosporangium saharense]MBB4917428.1 hypothetical protein [Streptosporangium saharense]
MTPAERLAALLIAQNALDSAMVQQSADDKDKTEGKGGKGA